MKHDVSIIIPCYQQAHWLGEAIESALANNPKEVIVVNDGSTDNTTEVALKYPVTLIVQQNKKLPGARNAGIRLSTGKYILTLDADDKIAPSFLEKTVGVDDIVGVAQQEFGDSNNLHTFLPHPTHEDFRRGNQINCCSLFKREIWDKIGGYDESMIYGYEDWLYNYIATKQGYTVTTIPEPLFFYRKHGSSMVNEAQKHHDELHRYILSK